MPFSLTISGTSNKGLETGYNEGEILRSHFSANFGTSSQIVWIACLYYVNGLERKEQK